MSASAKPPAEPIGTAAMTADRTLILDLRAKGDHGERGMARFVYPPSHRQYQDILRHVGPIAPGETKLVNPWP
jgi:hypothetical protein